MNTTKPGPIVQPYLFFEGRCEEALEFYRNSLGAEVLFSMRYKDAPPQQQQPGCTPPDANKIMHASFRVGQTTLMASDGRCDKPASYQGFSLSLTLSDTAEAERYFKALSNGGQIMMPLAKTFFSPSFGMVTDRFGVMWMVYVHQ